MVLLWKKELKATHNCLKIRISFRRFGTFIFPNADSLLTNELYNADRKHATKRRGCWSQLHLFTLKKKPQCDTPLYTAV